MAANVATASLGMIPVGFGLLATAGTLLAGMSFVMRDVVQDVSGRKVALFVLALGCLLSAYLASPALALASAVAFGAAELLDMAVYTPLRKRGWARAAIASNAVGGLVDTFAFLWLAGFPVTVLAVMGQLVGKAWATVAVVGGAVAMRKAVKSRAVSDHALRG